MNAISSSTSAGRDDLPAAPVPVTGLALLLAVLAVLCLAGLSVLSLSTAQTNWSRSLQLQQSRDAWYDACNRANLLAAEIDRRLQEADNSGKEADLTGLDLQRQGDRIRYTVPVDDRQILSVELQLTDTQSNYYYHVTAWQLLTTAPRGESSIQLMTRTGGSR